METFSAFLAFCAGNSSSNGTFSAFLAFCAGNSPVTGEFPTQRPVTRSFDIFFDLRLKQQLRKQWGRRWFKTPPCSAWRHFVMHFDMEDGSLRVFRTQTPWRWIHSTVLQRFVYAGNKYDDVMIWRCFPPYCHFVRGIHPLLVKLPMIWNAIMTRAWCHCNAILLRYRLQR